MTKKDTGVELNTAYHFNQGLIWWFMYNAIEIHTLDKRSLGKFDLWGKVAFVGATKIQI